LRAAVLVLLTIVACARRDPPTVAPTTPLTADPAIELATMQVECDAMVNALAMYKACKNLEPEDVEDLDAWIEAADRNLAASRKANPEPNAQQAIAAACRKATESVKAAAARCAVGPRPKD
jgi:fructose-specific phosphotransferase system component IIB